MHIGLASPRLPRDGTPNGVVTYVETMRAALRAAGHRVSVVALDQLEDDAGNIIPLSIERSIVDRLRGRLRRVVPHGGEGLTGGIDTLRRTLQAHRHDPFDIFETEEAFGLSAPMEHVLGCPIVVRLHGPHVYGRDAIEPPAIKRQGDVRERAERRAIMAATAITCPSARLLEATLGHYALRPELAEVIPNPIVAVAAGERWSSAVADSKQLLCIGRFDLRKGADIVLQAFAIAAARDPALKLVMAGPDAGLRQTDGTLLHYPDYLARHIPLALHDRIRFLGPIPAAGVAALRRASGCAIVASRFENFAYSVAEGMALGMPAIVSDSFGNGEMIEDDVSGLVVPVEDIAATAAAITRVTADAHAMAEMGAHAWERCRVWLDPARVANETIELYGRARRRFEAKSAQAGR